MADRIELDLYSREVQYVWVNGARYGLYGAEMRRDDEYAYYGAFSEHRFITDSNWRLDLELRPCPEPVIPAKRRKKMTWADLRLRKPTE